MRKCENISPYMRRPLVICDFATAPLWISLFMRKIGFSFLSVYVPLAGPAAEGRPLPRDGGEPRVPLTRPRAEGLGLPLQHPRRCKILKNSCYSVIEQFKTPSAELVNRSKRKDTSSTASIVGRFCYMAPSLRRLPSAQTLIELQLFRYEKTV